MNQILTNKIPLDDSHISDSILSIYEVIVENYFDPEIEKILNLINKVQMVRKEICYPLDEHNKNNPNNQKRFDISKNKIVPGKQEVLSFWYDFDDLIDKGVSIYHILSSTRYRIYHKITEFQKSIETYIKRCNFSENKTKSIVDEIIKEVISPLITIGCLLKDEGNELNDSIEKYKNVTDIIDLHNQNEPNYGQLIYCSSCKKIMQSTVVPGKSYAQPSPNADHASTWSGGIPAEDTNLDSIILFM